MKWRERKKGNATLSEIYLCETDTLMCLRVTDNLPIMKLQLNHSASMCTTSLDKCAHQTPFGILEIRFFDASCAQTTKMLNEKLSNSNDKVFVPRLWSLPMSRQWNSSKWIISTRREKKKQQPKQNKWWQSLCTVDFYHQRVSQFQWRSERVSERERHTTSAFNKVLFDLISLFVK